MQGLKQNSERLFNLSICSPLDVRLAAQIVQRVKQSAPNVQLVIKSYLNDNIEHQLRYQETEFVIGYTEFDRPDFHRIPLFKDELVLAVSKDHPRIHMIQLLKINSFPNLMQLYH